MPSIYDHKTRMLTEDEQAAILRVERDAYMKQMKDMMIRPIHHTNPIYNSPPEPSISIDHIYYFKHIYKIQLLHQVGAITAKEVARLIGMLDSTDPENWTVAEECINQKFSEI